MKNESRLQKAFYSTFTSGIYQVLYIVCGFVTQRLILGAFGSAYNGVVASITQFLNFFTIFSVGISGATRVALYKTLSKQDIIGTSAIIKANKSYYRKVAVGLIIYIIILAVIFPTVMKKEAPVFTVNALVLIIGMSNFASTYWGNTFRVLLIADQKSYIINTINSLALILNVIVLWSIIRLRGDIVGAKLGSNLIYFLCPLIIFLIVKKSYNLRNDVQPDYSALNGRWDVLANSFANIIHGNVDIFFITMFCSAIEISVYSIYFTVSDGLMKLMNVITNGIEAAFGNMWAKGEKDNLRSNLNKFEYLMFSLSIVLFGSLYVLLVPFMSVYTKNITDADYLRPTLALVFALSELTMSVRTPYVLLVQAAGHYKQTKIGSFIEAGLNVFLTFFLVMKTGIIGAIIGTIIANLFRSIQYGVYASKHIIERPLSTMFLKFLWLFITLCVCVKSAQLACSFFAVSNWGSWILYSVVCVFVHILIVFLSSALFYRQDLQSVVKLTFRLVKRG